MQVWLRPKVWLRPQVWLRVVVDRRVTCLALAAGLAAAAGWLLPQDWLRPQGVLSCLPNFHRKFPLLQKGEDETAIVEEGQKEEEDNMNPSNINVATPNNSARFSQRKEAQTSCVAVAGMERRSANLRPSN
ncbi:hypothetical protein F2Q70_00043483 [Brassica cretica]|uniref:Uncharacterized protein n=1 Tax=Brassica cretica TaxID=69181 RepID=A0A8S9KHC2_BRACR|nr:hypothetical protein F2Q70_00043483 [Brassica cretica]